MTLTDSVANIDPTDPALPVAYRNVLVENCNVNRCVGNGALQVFIVDNLVVRGTQANDLSNPEVVFSTFAHTYYGRNIEMFTCQGNGVQQTDPFSLAQCGGCDIEKSANIFLKDCQFNDAFGEASRIVNSNLSLNYNAIYENCQFNNSRGGATAGYVTGVHGSKGPGSTLAVIGTTFINCQFNGARIAANNPGGDYISALGGCGFISDANIILENCQVCNIITENPNYGIWGISVGTQPYNDMPPQGPARNVTVKNCIVSDLAGGVDVVGIWSPVRNYNLTGYQGIVTNVIIENCIAERISSSTTDPTHRVAGIAESLFPFVPAVPSIPTRYPTQYDRIRNLFIRGCRVSDVRSTSDIPIPLSAGILVESVQNPVIVENSVSDCDRGILFTGTDVITPNGFQLALSPEDATAFPPVFVDLITIPAGTPMQNFNNLTQSNSVSIAPSTTSVDTQHDFILPAADLTALGWQPGDTIHYDCNAGSPISSLVCGTDYYAIVYTPGFSKNGLIQNNEVDNCSISCYQDDLDTTSSAWVNNTAFNCGVMPTQFTNYDIDFAGVRPVDAGTLSAYPVGGNKYYNLSLVP